MLLNLSFYPRTQQASRPVPQFAATQPPQTRVTKAEIVQAHATIERANQQAYEDGKAVLNYVKKYVGGEDRSFSLERSPYYLHALIPKYNIVLTCETYGPYKADFIQQLKKTPNVKIAPDEQSFTIETGKIPELAHLPETEYRGVFGYFDNHVGGY